MKFMKNDQNKIGLIIADDNEIQQMDEFKFIKLFKGTLNVKLYEFKSKQIYVIHSGIGLVNATMATQFLIDNFEIKHIWNYGAVGATIGSNLKVYDVVIPKKFYYYDVITPWYKRGQTPNEDEFFLNSLKNADDYNIGSGNSFITKNSYIEEINKEIKVDLIDMESTAIAQTCKKNNIEFYCVKAVSDVIGKNSKKNDEINESIKTASRLAFKKILEIWII